MIGMFGELGMLGHELGEVVRWSPYGTVKRLLSASMDPHTWTQDTTLYLLATLVIQ
jgi:ABC-2 type transport system permease protein